MLLLDLTYLLLQFMNLKILCGPSFVPINSLLDEM